MPESWKRYRALWAASLVLLIAQGVYYYPLLPDEVVSRIGVGGEARSTMAKEGFYAIWYVLAVGMGNMWAGLLPMIIRSSPKSINIPDKQFWLATPERTAYLIERSLLMLFKLFVGTNVLLGVVFWEFATVNMGPRTGQSVGPLALGIYLVALFGYMLWWMLDLRRKKPRFPDTGASRVSAQGS